MKQFLEVGWYITGDEVKMPEKDFATLLRERNIALVLVTV